MNFVRIQDLTPRARLWRCPECGERFTTRNQSHSCGSFDLDALFTRCDPVVRQLYERFVGIVKACGPARVIPQKTRIALQVRMRFAALMPQKAALKGHLVLARRREDARFLRIDSYSRRSHVHVFRLRSEQDLDDTFCSFIAEAYEVGRQEHLKAVPRGPSPVIRSSRTSIERVVQARPAKERA